MSNTEDLAEKVSGEVEFHTDDIEYLDVDNIRIPEWNPNEQDEETFQELVAEIDEEGFDEAILVIPDDHQNFDYVVVAGEHRLKAVRALGSDEIASIVREDWTEEDHKKKMVKRNLLRGELNEKKFTELLESLAADYGINPEEIPEELGFRSTDEMMDHYVGDLLQSDNNLASSAEDIAEGVAEDESFNDEMDVVDDLSSMVNHILSEHGDTVDEGYVYFMFDQHPMLMISMDSELRDKIESAKKKLKNQSGTLTGKLKEFLDSL